MRKILMALTVLALTSTSSFAQYRHEHHHHLGNSIWPWVAGAAIVGAIVGSAWYDNYGRRCWREVIAYDNFGNPIVRTFCNY
jgi:hypothetical protein